MGYTFCALMKSTSHFREFLRELLEVSVAIPTKINVGFKVTERTAVEISLLPPPSPVWDARMD